MADRYRTFIARIVDFFYILPKSKKKPGIKWLIYVLLAFLGNGLCSTVQKMEQLFCGDTYGNIFMAIALLTGAVILSAASLIKDGAGDTLRTTKKYWPLAAVYGVMNGIVNFLVMLLNGRIAASIMFPVISAGSIVIVFIISLIFYRERFSKVQLFGFFTGVAAIVLLNL